MSSVQRPCHGEQISDPGQDPHDLLRKKNLVLAVYANELRLPRRRNLNQAPKLQVVGFRLYSSHHYSIFVSFGLVDPPLAFIPW